MAKAILGYVGGPDPRLFEEARRLRVRVRDLEAQILRLQAENDSLVTALHEGEVLTVGETETKREPALT
ncbi:MAG: hypothetical protein GEU93_02095 [Propionibacteriales bacterium]|nr:hypothetical protein [Propionibacteriales bacterium]